MSHIAYPPSDSFMTLVHAGEALADKGSSRLARRVDEALRRFVALDEAVRSIENPPDRVIKAIAGVRSIITE